MRIDSLVRIALCALIAMNCVLGAGFAEPDINIDDRVNLSYANLLGNGSRRSTFESV